MADYGGVPFRVLPGSDWLAPAMGEGQAAVSRFAAWDATAARYTTLYQVRPAGNAVLALVADLAAADFAALCALADGVPRTLGGYPVPGGAEDIAGLLLMPIEAQPVPYYEPAAGATRHQVAVTFERPK